MANVIEVLHLSKQYGTLRAVDDVSFTIAEGEVFGILGPNGAGKTTTLECIEGIQEPTAGEVRVLGWDVRRERERIKERIGVQLQASAYFEYLTLSEILELFGRFYPRRIGARELLRRVQLEDKARATVAQLSGGQRQRFTIAASLVNDPEVVFLDEPTTGLDPQARRNAWELIEEMHREGRTVVLTTHYMEEAQALCDRVAIMDHGRIVALDSPVNLVRGTLSVPYRIRFAAAGQPPMEEWRAWPGVQAVEATDGMYSLAVRDPAPVLERLLAWSRANGAGLRHLEVVPATLEDVFLALTGHALRE